MDKPVAKRKKPRVKFINSVMINKINLLILISYNTKNP